MKYPGYDGMQYLRAIFKSMNTFNYSTWNHLITLKESKTLSSEKDDRTGERKGRGGGGKGKGRGREERGEGGGGGVVT